MEDKPIVEQVKESKETSLPNVLVGTKFKIGDFEYKVTYINYGKKRFSCEPV